MRRSSRLLLLLLVLTAGDRLLLTQGLGGGPVPPDVAAQVAAGGSALVIVGVRAPFAPEGLLDGPEAVRAQRDALHAAVDATMARAAGAGAVIGARFETIPFFTARVNQEALAALVSMPEVASVGLDELARPFLGQSVPLVNAPAAWSAGHTGAGWKVAILDTGVDKNHGFLTGKVPAGGEACYSNANNLGTGLSLCPGGAGSSTAAGSGLPCSSTIGGCDHGTHVAGIAAGLNGPGGIHGVAPGAGLIALQVFTRFDDPALCGSSTPCVLSYSSDQVRALERVLALAGAANANQIASANMSLGGGQYFAACDTANSSISAVKAAIDNLRSLGIATVIATGNNGFTNSISSPACISTSVAVGSSTKADMMSSFTNRRPGLVSLLAPGSSITASVLNNGFAVKSGTSMATPHVAGAWAVLKQAVPGAGVAQVLAALQDTGVAINDPSSDPGLAAPMAVYPRINVNAARLALLGSGSGVPGPPGAPVVTGSGNTITLSWTAPATGGPPTGYDVIARLAPGGAPVATLAAGNVLSTTVTAPNGTFHVTVRASNGAGTGPESAGTTVSVPFVPPPGAPTGLNVSVSGNQATFTWTPPSTGGPPDSYILQASMTTLGPPIAELSLPAPASSINVSDIPTGTYFVRLFAANAGGVSPGSNEVSLTVAGPQPPGPPLLNVPVVTGNQVILSWQAPTTGGQPTSYRVVASLTTGGPPVATLNVAGNGTTVAAPSGTYHVWVHGVNAVGQGPASNERVVNVP